MPDSAVREDNDRRFWEIAEPFLGTPGVTRSTMMGHPCLRIDRQFFGSYDVKTGDLLVKLPEARVEELIGAGDAHDFAPAGRRFREWAAIPPTLVSLWPALLNEAKSFVAGLRPPRPR